MALLGLLIALVLLGTPIAVIVLIISVGNLKRRVALLESELAFGSDRSDTTVPSEATLAEPPPEAEKPPDGIPPQPALAPLEPTQAPPSAAPSPEPVRQPTGPGTIERGFAWLRDNWVYAVSAVSLGLAGIFLVQYGVERGLLSPPVRVALALLFGFSLIIAGEVIRRRWGDDEDRASAFLPSTLSAAGIVVLYAAILAARGLYGLIGPELAFGGLVLVSAVALIFGWFYGPFLAAAGLSGATAAPFLIGGEADSAMPFYIFYALLCATGLGIDAIRRWGWVSALSLALSYAAGTTVYLMGGEFTGFAAMLVWFALVAVAAPRLEVWPSHPGASLTEAMSLWPNCPTRPIIPPVLIAAAAFAATAALLTGTALEGDAGGQLLTFLLLAALAAFTTLWTIRAPALWELPVLPAGAFLLLLLALPDRLGALFRDIRQHILAPEPGAAPPTTLTILLAVATVVSLSAAWRSGHSSHKRVWAAVAALYAPLAAVVMHVFWLAPDAIGAYAWAGHVIALATAMTGMAAYHARADGGPGPRTAYATLAALSLIALSLFTLLSAAALTVALSVLVAVAAGLDRRFNLREMTWFLVAGVVTLGWRLVLDPGLLVYLADAPLSEVVLAFGSALAGLALALWLLASKARGEVRAVLESGIWAYGGVFATVLLWRAIDRLLVLGTFDAATHWVASLFGLLWTILAVAQAWRLRAGGALKWLRVTLLLGYLALSVVAFFLATVALNPLVPGAPGILGPFLLDTALVAYVLPGLLFVGLARQAPWLGWRRTLTGTGAVFLGIYVVLEIRRVWHVDVSLSQGVTQPELYTYTVAMLLLGAGLLWQALARHSPGLRRLAMTVIALTAAKVFLIDAAGLTGLLRVFSFLLLGLVLAGLAWLNRWAATRSKDSPSG